MTRLSPRHAPTYAVLVLALVLAACADGTAPAAPEFARKWFTNAIVVVEDVVNPCNGQTMHLTSQLTYADAFSESGRQQNRLTVVGAGTSDDGTTYALRSLSRADAVPLESELVWLHEEVTASTPGGSYRRKVQVHIHVDGTGEVHQLVDDRRTCR